MSNAVKQGTHFIKEVMARLEGDADKVVAEKNARLAVAALSGQIAALTGSIVKQEINVDQAKDSLADAQFPTVIISDTQIYCDNITHYQNNLDSANDKLEGLKESQANFQSLLDSL